MRELTDILTELDRVAGVATLATVVRVSGSAYRRPGARMLIATDGRISGGVSGGCLERDVVRRAGGVMASGKPMLVRYDTSPDPDGGPTYALGCGGSIDVLIEPLNTSPGRIVIDALRAFHSNGPGVLASVVASTDPAVPVSCRFSTGSLATVFDPQAGIDAIDVLNGKPVGVRRYETADGFVEIFFDRIAPPPRLILLGAGHDVPAVVTLAKAVGWHVTVVDLRSAPPQLGTRLQPDRMVRCDVADIDSKIQLDADTAVVVMTHNYNHDASLLSWLSTVAVGYVGMLGPRHRTEHLLGEFGLSMPGLRYPIGLDIGAETPEEVALSIVAEITAVRSGRPGGALRDQPGPIHGTAGPRSEPNWSAGREVYACTAAG